MAPVVLLRVAAALRQMVRLSEPPRVRQHRSSIIVAWVAGAERVIERAPVVREEGSTQTLPGHPSHNAG